jgi:hypothetical protein
VGYNVYVARRHNWYDDDGPQIAAEEWRQLVDADPDLAMVGFAEASVDNAVLRYESPFLAQMVTRPDVQTAGAWLDLEDGMIVVKNPDDTLLAKMVQIAEALGARVQGEEGEYYDSAA